MQLTIRRVDPEWVKIAKRKAARKGVSMNQFILDALRDGAGDVAEQKRRTNLDKFAGDTNFGPTWNRYLEFDLNLVDSELWT